MMPPRGKQPKVRNAEKALSYVVSVLTILAIVGGLYGFYSSQRDKRVEKTFEFYKTFRADPLRKDWASLMTRWNKSAQKAKSFLDQNKDDDLAALVLSLFDGDDEGKDAFGRVADFFDEFNSCIEHSLCDKNSAIALLEQSAKEFVGAFGPYISVLRKEYGDEKFGSGIYKVKDMTPESSLCALFLH
jgi:hypothetical protein